MIKDISFSYHLSNSYRKLTFRAFHLVLWQTLHKSHHLFVKQSLHDQYGLTSILLKQILRIRVVKDAGAQGGALALVLHQNCLSALHPIPVAATDSPQSPLWRITLSS